MVVGYAVDDIEGLIDGSVIGYFIVIGWLVGCMCQQYYGIIFYLLGSG